MSGEPPRDSLKTCPGHTQHKHTQEPSLTTVRRPQDYATYVAMRRNRPGPAGPDPVDPVAGAGRDSPGRPGALDCDRDDAEVGGGGGGGGGSACQWARAWGSRDSAGLGSVNLVE